jgi:NAD+ synthase
MPNGEQNDIDCSYRLVEHLGIRHYVVNIAEGHRGILSALPEELTLTAQAKTNLPPRLRMTTLYLVSQCLGGRVANTCNLSENYVGYSTRYGDDAGDFSPLGNLTVREVVAIGHALGLPPELVMKVPSDGLCGKTDEDNLGFTYAMLDTYIREGVCPYGEKRARIDRLHKMNLFKLRTIPQFDPEI